MNALHRPSPFMLIVFSHANSFPASTYNVLFRSLRARGYTVRALEKLGHDPLYPVTSNWPQLVRQLAEFTQAAVDEHGTPAYLVGHSLGGYLSLMTACRHPELVSGLVLLDSPVLGGWRANALALAKYTGLAGSFSPGAVSLKRRNRWANAEQALAHFQSKKAFAKWEPQVLRDYIAHGTHDEGGQRALSFDRAVETAIYNNLPHNLDRLQRTHPLKCPAAYIGGAESAEMKQVGMARTHQVTQGRVTLMPGSHLFPMEAPLATAAAIDAAIRQLAALPTRA
jgi:pimeloyl-ACP methyl ester carboxylesterase